MARELWNVDYETHAYLDQTGASRDGYVVREIVFVEDLGPGDWTNGYTGRVERGALLRAVHPETGRVFESRPVYDYAASRHWFCESDRTFWTAPPASTKRYVWPDGTAVSPVGTLED